VTPVPIAAETARAVAEGLKRAAADLGIDRIGIASPDRLPPRALYDRWIGEGRHAGMAYLMRHREERADPARLLPGLGCVVSVALGYRPAGEPPAAAPRVARYAWGEDYHDVLGRKLAALLEWVRGEVPGARGRCAVDTLPILERHWAERAGVGWIGRNGCLIAPGLGSWVFLGEILLDLPLPASPPLESRCGACRRCIDACPGGAIGVDSPLDARRCVAYWTVEHRGPFPADGRPRLAPWLFGCDVCQEACPHNRRAPVTREPAWSARPAWAEWGEAQWERLDGPGFDRALARTPMARAGLIGIRRNLEAWRTESGRRPD
jgi:epoxyqueuosine reductase